MAELGDKYFNANNPDYANSYLEKYKLDNMEAKADFYGKVADDYGASANARESNMKAPAEAGSSFDGMGFAKGAMDSSGGSGADVMGNGLMASGNPYAMAAGSVLKVASMGQKREQAKMNAQRQAYLDRNNRMREVTDKLIAMDYGV